MYHILHRLGISTFVDLHSIREGKSNRLEMVSGLYGCTHGALILSDNFLDSRWCRRELHTLYQRHLDNNREGMTSNESSSFKLLIFFESRRLIDSVEDYCRLREIGSTVLVAGISDRRHLLQFMLPKLLSKVMPQTMPKRGEIGSIA